jgi:hypothetical protein
MIFFLVKNESERFEGNNIPTYFLRNVELCPNYTVLQLKKDRTLHHHYYSELENIQRKFANLYHIRVIQPDSFCNYESVLNYLHFKTLYSRRRNVDALFLINVFKNKIYCSVTDSVGLRVPTKQIRGFSTFNVSNASRRSPSTRCVTAANNIRKSPDLHNKHNISLEDTFSFAYSY